MIEYTDLDIHQAIDLVEAGCEDVQYNCSVCYYNLKRSSSENTFKNWIDTKYRIETSKLKEWNDKKDTHNWNDFTGYCYKCGVEFSFNFVEKDFKCNGVV